MFLSTVSYPLACYIEGLASAGSLLCYMQEELQAHYCILLCAAKRDCTFESALSMLAMDHSACWNAKNGLCKPWQYEWSIRTAALPYCENINVPFRAAVLKLTCILKYRWQWTQSTQSLMQSVWLDANIKIPAFRTTWSTGPLLWRLVQQTSPWLRVSE